MSKSTQDPTMDKVSTYKKIEGEIVQEVADMMHFNDFSETQFFMKKIFILCFLFHGSLCAISQSFEGKLTYLLENRSKIDTQYVYIRGDSIRADKAKWLDASTSLYFISKNKEYVYSKWKKTYLEYPIIKPDQVKEVLAFDLKHNQDSTFLYYKERTLNTALNIETTTICFLKLNPQLKIPFLNGTFVEPYVLNGSGYVSQQISVSFLFNVMGEKRGYRSRLIAIDRTKPSIELFEMKGN